MARIIRGGRTLERPLRGVARQRRCHRALAHMAAHHLCRCQAEVVLEGVRGARHSLGAVPPSSNSRMGRALGSILAQPDQAGRVGALEVRSEKDRGRVYELRKERTTIGRSRDSDIFLDDLAVSRLHLVIFRDDQGRYVLHDENSANGVYVNGQRVGRDQLLEDGDEVQVGQVVLAFGRR